MDALLRDRENFFRQWSAKPMFEKIEDGDFEWVFTLRMGFPDRYYYCFKDEVVTPDLPPFLSEDYAELQ